MRCRDRVRYLSRTALIGGITGTFDPMRGENKLAKPWFRMYREVLSSPKIQKLRPETFRAWINLLCCTSDDGCLPSRDDIAFMLRLKPSKVQDHLSELIAAKLIDEENGQLFAHDWDEHQFQSDVSTDRVKRFRKRYSNGERNAPDTDTDTDHSRAEQNPRPNKKTKRTRLDEMLDDLKRQEKEKSNGVS